LHEGSYQEAEVDMEKTGKQLTINALTGNWRYGQSSRYGQRGTRRVQQLMSCQSTYRRAHRGQYEPSRSLRSSDRFLLARRASDLFAPKKAFSVKALMVWNSLIFPLCISAESLSFLNAFQNWFIVYCILVAYLVIVISRLWFTWHIGSVNSTLALYCIECLAYWLMTICLSF